MYFFGESRVASTLSYSGATFQRFGDNVYPSYSP